MRSLGTKEGRENLLNYEFDRMQKRGHKKEIYKDLTIWTGCEENKYYLRIFRGTSTKPICNYYYRNEQSRNSSLEGYKQTADRRENFKTERKTRTGFVTGAAACAAAIRTELKNVFPEVKFSVTSETFSMGDSVSIHWIDGPTTSEVEKFTGKYQYGHFNGMEDIYEYSNCVDDRPQSKYVQESRSMDKATESKLIELLTPVFELDDWGCHNVQNLAYRLFCKTSFPKNAIIKELAKTGETCGCCDINVFWRVSFEGETELIDWDLLLTA